MKRVLSAVLLLGVGLASPRAAAQSDPSRDGAAALVLFDEARRLLAAGDVAAACTRFEESHRMSPLPGTLLNLANCHEKLGKLATAWGEYREALTLARVDGRADRVQFAEERLAALEPRLPTLVIELAAPVSSIEGLQVLRDGVLLGAAAMGVRLPVDPGAHVIEARAPGRASFRIEVHAVEGGAETVVIPELAPVEAPRPPVSPVAAPPRFVPSPPPTPEDPGPSPLWISGWTFGGLGAAAAIAGVIAGAYALSEEAAAEDLGCTDRLCFSEEAFARSRRANTAATAANVLLPLGVVLTGTGITLLVLAPTSSRSDATPGVAVAVSGALW